MMMMMISSKMVFTLKQQQVNLKMHTLISCLVVLIVTTSSRTQADQTSAEQKKQQQAPSIIPFSFNSNVQANESAIVICTTASGEKPVNFTWLKNGRPLSAKAGPITIEPEIDSSKLKISSVRFSHAGNYTCLAENRFGKHTHNAQLVVHGKRFVPTPWSYDQTSNYEFKNHRRNATAARHRRQSSGGGGGDLLDGAHAQPQDTQPYADEPMALAGDQDQESQQQQAHTANSRSSGGSQAPTAGKRTLYACEKEQLEIECQLGDMIQMVRANYGRFSIQICNDHGQLDWKVNCMSPQSYDIIARSCQNKQSCQLLASNDVFGDSCPGTQKYLEVHYQCVPANRTATQITRANTNVIQYETTTPQGSNSDSGTSPQQQFVMRPPHWPRPPIVSPPGYTQPQPQPQLPPSTSPATSQLPHWIQPGLITTPVTVVGSTTGAGTPRLQGATDDLTTTTANYKSALDGSGVQYCPEVVMRGVRWPTTEAGHVAHMPCPAHTFPSAAAAASYSTTLVCHRNGQWADRMQAGHCQSSWLRNLTQRLEAGDSPLSILSDLVQFTQPTIGSANYWASSGGLLASSAAIGASASHQHTTPLFGDDLVQIGHVVGRLVEAMGDQLARISDDKQRISFARSMIQLFVDLVSNLAGEQQQSQSGAWTDLASTTGERQRVAGQLVSGLESACVLLAGALQQSSGSSSSVDGSSPAEDFHKVTDFVYVAIQTFSLDSKQRQQLANGSPASYLQKFQVTFPSQTSLLGTRWMNSDQKFTLNLQASNSLEVDQQTGQPSLGQQQQLKIVSVMLRGLGAQMDPIAAQQQQQRQSSDKSSSTTAGADVTSAGQQLVVNSDLVSFSIVADSMRSSIKVDLSAPIELVFKHNNNNNYDQQQSGGSFFSTRQETTTPTMPAGRQGAAYCVYWDATTSDWLPDGCKLVATNRTHSVCACNHLTTFALLSELDQTSSSATTSANDQATRFNHRLPRVNLDSVEQELNLAQAAAAVAAFDGGQPPLGATIKTIHMAKLLEGNLFAYQQGTRTFLYVSCCLSALLLALLLAAAAYNRAHARRLLGSMPAEPPPSLLVANYHNTVVQHHRQPQPLIETSTTTATSGTTTSPPTSYSSQGVSSSDLMVKQDGAAILGQEDEMNGFYSLIGNGGANQYAPASQQQLAHAASYHHLTGNTGGPNPNYPRKQPTPTGLSHLALVPIHLIVHLLLLQLLLLLLIESQNFLQWNSQQAKQRAAYLHSLDPLIGPPFQSAANDQAQQQALAGGDLINTLLNPIGTITWLIVFALYYLVSTLAFWLLAKLVQLNGRLALLNSKLSAAALNVLGGQKQAHHYHQQSLPIISGSIYQQQQQQQMPQVNRYGQCQVHNQQQSSNSPTLSAFSSSLAQDPGIQHQYAAGGGGGQSQLNKLQKDSIYGRQLHAQTTMQSANHVHGLVRLLTSAQLAACLTHLGPLLMSGLLVWLTYERVQLINLLAFTTSMSSQLAYWPLAVNASWTFPMAVLLFCLPCVCLALGLLALVFLRHNFRQIYGPGGPTAGAGGQATTTTTATSLIDGSQQQQHLSKHHHLESAAETLARAGGGGGKKSRPTMNPSAQLVVELAMESKCAKFVCLTLLALLSLNSICWISFFIHCHQAISQSGPQAGGSSGADGSGNHLILAFASSNLLISLLICCSQRQQLRRACHLLGLSRLALALSKACCQLGDATKCSPASSLSASSSYYGGGGGGNGQHHQEAAGQHLQQQQHYGTGKSIKISSAPSQQSLFAISRSRPVGEHLGQQQQAYQSGAYGHAGHYPPIQQQQQQQHLYQQLAAADANGHIYDSATNLNSNATTDSEQALSAFHLMAQHQQQRGPFNNPLPQHQHQQQQPMINYTLGRTPYHVANVTGPNFHLDPHPLQQQQQHPHHHQHGFNGGGGGSSMTLKLQSGVGMGQQQQVVPYSPAHHQLQQQQQGARRAHGGGGGNPHDLLMCPISAAAGQQQQQPNKRQQLSTPSSASSSGEADGPLVALAKTTTTQQSIASNNNNNKQHQFSIATNQSTPATFGPTTQQQQQHFQLATTEHRQSDDMTNGGEFALNDAGHGGSGNQGRDESPTGPIKHCNYGSSMASGVGNAGTSQQQNYTEALRTAMAQEANQQQQHFRRTNSAAMRHHHQQQQQQQQQQHRSFASSASASSGTNMMIDAHHHQQGVRHNFGDILASGTHAPSRSSASTNNGAGQSNNIYDVANCGAGLSSQ